MPCQLEVSQLVFVQHRAPRFATLVCSYNAPKMYNWFQEKCADFLRMREPHGVRQSGRAGLGATNCESIYKNYDLHDATAAAAYTTKATGYLNKIRLTPPGHR